MATFLVSGGTPLATKPVKKDLAVEKYKHTFSKPALRCVHIARHFLRPIRLYLNPITLKEEKVVTQ